MAISLSVLLATAIASPLAAGPASVEVLVPDGRDLDQVVLGAQRNLTVTDRVTVIGGLTTAAGARARIGNDSDLRTTVISVPPVRIGHRTSVGTVLSAGTIRLESSASMGAGSPDGAFTDVASVELGFDVPDESAGAWLVRPDQVGAWGEPRYGTVNLKSRSTTVIAAGTWFADRLVMEPQSRLVVDDTLGPVTLVLGSLVARGDWVDGTDDGVAPSLRVVQMSSSSIALETAFDGAVLAPLAPLSLRGNQLVHRGTFVGLDVTVTPGNRVIHRSLPSDPDAIATLAGVIVDPTSGQPLSDCTVRVGGQVGLTDEGGAFLISGLRAGTPLSVEVSLPGYATGGRTLTLQPDTSTFVDLPLLPVQTTALDAATGGSVRGGGATVQFSGGTLGSDGLVDCQLTVLDPRKPEERSAFPGSFRTRSGELLESFGAIYVDAVDEGGVPVAPEGPFRVQLPIAGPAPSDTLPLWWFDAALGTWVQEGTLTGCLSGLCEATVTRFGWWNIDVPLPTTCLEVCAVDGAGAAAAGVSLVADGVDYLGSSYAVTGDDGCACLTVSQDAIVDVAAETAQGRVSLPSVIETGASLATCGGSCTELPTPIVLGPVSRDLTLGVDVGVRFVGERTFAELGWGDMGGVGDVSGDGALDVVFSGRGSGPTFVFDTPPTVGGVAVGLADTLLVDPARRSGFAASNVGDLDGDGVDDVAVSSPNLLLDGVSSGRVHVFSGPLNGTLSFDAATAVISGEPPFERLGRVVKRVGDLNGDGFDDLVLASIASDGSGGLVRGYLHVFHGPVVGALSVGDADALVSGVDGGILGNDFAAAGDVDGDGRDDLFVGDRLARIDGFGRVGAGYVLPGVALVGSTTVDGIASATFASASTGQAGSGVAIGDLNADGVTDFVLGSTSQIAFDGTFRGGIQVVFGPVTGRVNLENSDVTLLAEPRPSIVGEGLEVVGDVDGDGFDDLVVGDRRVDARGVVASGSAYLVRGPFLAGTHELGEADVRLRGEGPSHGAGSTVGSIGDIDGDGKADFLVGAPGYSVDVRNRGAIYLVYGKSLFP